MKRGGPLTRRTPLRSVSSLRRVAPLQGGAPLARVTPLRPVSEKRPRSAMKPARTRDTGPDRDTRTLVLERDGHRCFCCGTPLFDQPASIQHRGARGMGGTSNPLINSPANLILLAGTGCTGCHGRVESRDTADNRLGYWLRMGQVPADTPVWHWRLGWVLLDHNGGITPVRDAA